MRLKSWLLYPLLGLLLLAGMLLWGAMTVLHTTPSRALAELDRRSPQELIRYADAALMEYGELHALLRPVLLRVQQRVERPTGSIPLPNLGKGHRWAAAPASLQDARAPATVQVKTAAELRQALLQARAGDVIELAPGRYRFEQSVKLGGPGSGVAPIRVRAAQPRATQIEMNTAEGFLIDQPYWVFEDLRVRGICPRDADCEHAFHIVAGADFFELRNSWLENFNAHLKINGVNGRWPDHGLISHNTLSNEHPRQTARSVTPVDLVGANFWRISDNLLRNFVKGEGDKVSYGIFVKGGGEGAKIERNLVVCSPNEISRPGVRVGISFGGGGSDPGFCRDKGCERYEHQAGLAVNNIVAHCNDVGLDVNHSRHILLAHNTLVNTAGMGLRGEGSQAQLYGNLFEGKLLIKNDGKARAEMEQPMKAAEVFGSADNFRMDWRVAPERIPSLPAVPLDFCGRKRPSGTYPGAQEETAACTDN